MTGKFEELYRKQIDFQMILSDNKLPVDDVKEFQYHMTAMTEELGEVLKADKRWKTHRNTTYNREEKLDELADCFITLMNLYIYSGFNTNDILDTVRDKIKINLERLKKEILKDE